MVGWVSGDNHHIILPGCEGEQLHTVLFSIKLLPFAPSAYKIQRDAQETNFRSRLPTGACNQVSSMSQNTKTLHTVVKYIINVRLSAIVRLPEI